MEFQIGVVIEDKEFTRSSMGGKPWKAGKFSLTLRLSLWSEHLGLQAGEVCKFHSYLEETICFLLWIPTDYVYIFSFQIDQIVDPIVESTYKDIWMERAMVIEGLKCSCLLKI